jgi:hypothetical protein
LGLVPLLMRGNAERMLPSPGVESPAR